MLFTTRFRELKLSYFFLSFRQLRVFIYSSIQIGQEGFGKEKVTITTE